MRFLRGMAVLAVTFVAGGGLGAHPVDLAIVDVTLVRPDEDSALPHQTVLVRGSRIEAVGDAGRVRVPAGAKVVDGRGRFLLPGLVDMHAHPRSVGELHLYLSHGVTTLRSLFGSPRQLRWRDLVARGRLLGPNLVVSSPVVDGSPAEWPEVLVADTPDEARRAVRESARRGYDWIKVYHRLPPAAFETLMAEARRLRLPVGGHVPARVGLRRAQELGLRTIEHLTEMDAALEVEGSPVRGRDDDDAWMSRVDHVDEDGLAALAREAKARGVWHCPTLVAYERWATTAGEARRLLSTPAYAALPQEIRCEWDPDLPDAYLDETRAAFMRRRLELHKRMTKALSDAGAGLLLGTDAGNALVVPGLAVHEELRLLVDAGLTPAEALRAATSEAAKALGRASRSGVVPPGAAASGIAAADLLLLEKDPRSDVANAAAIAGVVLRGRWLPASRLRALSAAARGGGIP